MLDIEQLKAFQDVFDSPFWEQVFLGNSYAEYMTAFAAFLGLVVALKILQFVTLRYLGRLSKKTATMIDDVLVRIVRTIRPPFYSFVALYLSVRLFLDMSALVGQILDGLLIIWVVYQVIFVAQVLIDYLVRRHLLTGEDDSGEESMIRILGMIVKVVLWMIGILVILSNLGFDVFSIIAGLGVFGIAVGLALQPVFTDLFSAFTIYLDKPFRVGDFISVNGLYGTVERIGIKTTRIKALSGEELVMTNSELTNSTITNIAQLERRRVSFYFGVTYETGMDRLREIPKLVEEATGGLEDIDFDRAHFKSFDDSALSFEVVYFVNTGNYVTYMDAQQEINLGICERFAKEKIDMAYPTQTVYQYNVNMDGEENT